MAQPGDRFTGAKRDATGRQRVHVLGPIIASGGEGTVYRAGPGEAIKLYHQPPDARQHPRSRCS